MEETRKFLEVGYGMEKGKDSFATGVKATQSAVSNIIDNPLSLMIVFSSVCYNLSELLRGIHSVIGDVPVIGTTTAGEICNSPQQESVVIVALASHFIKLRLGLGQAVSKDWKQALAQAVSAPEMQPVFSSQDRDYWQKLTQEGKTSFALLFSPGNTRYAHSVSYEILEELKRMSNGFLPIFGGSSADDWRMESNYVFLGQRVYSDSILIAVFETHLRFGIGLTHGFVPSFNQALVTKVSGHEVLELDRQPADEMYAKMMGTSKEALNGKHLTLTTGQPIGFPDPYGQYSINVASYFTPQGGVRFAQPVTEGSLFTIMEANPDEMIVAGREALRKALLRGSITEPGVAFVFSCALRTRILQERSKDEITFMKELLPEIPIVGFYSFGEQGLADDGVNRHNNEVITTLVIGQELTHSAQVALKNKRLIEVLEAQIDERQAAEKALRNSEAKYRQLFEMESDAIFLIRKNDGQIMEVNTAGSTLYGFSRDELLAMKNTDLSAEPDDTKRATMEKRRKVPIRYHRKKDGTVFPVEITASHFTWQDQEVHIAAIRDITSRLEAEKEKTKFEEQLRQAHKMEALWTLVGGIAHEFNNVLGIIIGNTDLSLYDVPEWNPAHYNLKEIKTASLRAKDVVIQLLSYVRKVHYKKKPMKVIPAVKDSIKLLRSTIPGGIAIRQNIQASTDTILADPNQIHQIMINLGTNAMHAMEKDGGILEIEIKNVNLGEESVSIDPDLMPGNYIKITVRDTGNGMEPEIVDRIFDPFFTTKEVGKGTGMGLSVVHGIVKSYKGAISVESELGKGTTLSVFFPVAAAEAVIKSKTVEKLPTGKERILFVDDEASIVNMAKQILERLGYQVEAKMNPVEALELFRSNPEQFNLVITDMAMPQMDGDKLAKEILNIRSGTPIILCTGFSEKVSEENAKDLGINAFVMKPLDERDFAVVVRKVLDKG